MTAKDSTSSGLGTRRALSRSCLLKNSLAAAFSKYIFPFISKERLSVLYSSNAASRPNTPVNVVVGALLLKKMFGSTDEELGHRPHEAGNGSFGGKVCKAVENQSANETHGQCHGFVKLQEDGKT
jgi:hypothetical protein